MKVSFVIPCYRSALTIEIVVKEIKDTISSHSQYDYEIVLVNDCSPDNTFEIITQLCLNDKKIKGINLAKNVGQPSATLAAFANATGNIIVYSDDDGQTPIPEMFKLIDKLNEGYDIVFAKFKEKQNSWFQNLGSKLMNATNSYLLDKPKHIHFGNFWISRKFVIEEAIKCKNPYPHIGGLLARTTLNMTDVPVDHRKRMSGKSTYTLKKMISLWLNGFTAFSVKPLRIATVMGFICSCIGFIYTLYIIVMKFKYPSIPMGYSSIMSVLLFVGGMLMLLLGMIGEYIGRIYMNINNSPQYVIRDALNTEQDIFQRN